MKKHLLIFTVAAAFVVTACNEKVAETDTVEHHDEEMHPDMDDHDEMMHETGSDMMAVPDYAAAPQAVKDQLNQVVEQYLKLKDAFVNSNEAEAKSAASTLEQAAKDVNTDALEEEQQSFAQEKIAKVSENASKMAQAGSLEEQRQHLQPLSEAIYALTKAFHASGKTMYYQHCPMANNNTGGYWLSSTKEIRNPYFGDKMMGCGSTKETLVQ